MNRFVKMALMPFIVAIAIVWDLLFLAVGTIHDLMAKIDEKGEKVLDSFMDI